MDTTMPDYVVNARNNATAANQTAGDFASKSFTIQDELKKVVQEALDYNKDVIQLRSGALSDYLKAPSDAGARFGTQTDAATGGANPNYIFNPFDRNKAINDFIGSQETPFSLWNSVLGMREGTTADTVDAGTRAFQASASNANTKATNASNTYKSLLEEFIQEQNLKAKSMELDIAQQNANTAATKGGGGSSLDAMDMLKIGAFQNETLQAAQTRVNSRIEAIKKSKGKVTEADYKSAWAAELPMLQNVGVSKDLISATIAGQQGNYDFYSPSTQKSLGSKISDFFKGPDPTQSRAYTTSQALFTPQNNPLLNSLNGLNLTTPATTSNLSKGLSNTGSFLNGYNFYGTGR